MRKVVFATANRKKTVAAMQRLNTGLCVVNAKINMGGNSATPRLVKR